MKILAFADTHGETDFSHLTELARDADLILCAGDLTDFSAQLEEVLEALHDWAERIGKPVVLTHGNHEGKGIGDLIEERFPKLRYIHKAAHISPQVAVIAYGGGGFSERDPAFEEFIRAAHDHKDMQGKLLIWLLHGPPFDLVVDTIPGWGPTGCLSKREMIDALQPHIVVSGHIHEAWGEAHQHGRTLLINPGPFGRLIEVNFDDGDGDEVADEADDAEDSDSRAEE